MVSAAVRVVLPWSTWPMVPMLTCGLLRSNFPLAERTTSSLPHLWPAGAATSMEVESRTRLLDEEAAATCGKRRVVEAGAREAMADDGGAA
jgi:hypothetical protein